MASTEMTAKQKAATLALLSESKANDLLYVHTVRDAAMLAGEQVQDIRLTVLEKPPATASDSHILIDVLVSLALSPAAEFLLRFVTESAVGLLLAKRKLAEGGGIDVSDFADNEVKGSGTAADAFLARDSKARELWNQRATDSVLVARDIVIEKVTTAGERSAAQLNDVVKAAAGDTASVTVRRCAMSFARQQERATSRAHDLLSARVSQGLVDAEAAALLKDAFASTGQLVTNQDPAGSDSVERRLSLLFEATIWALHLQAPDVLPKFGGEFKGMAMAAGSVPLFDYLIRRFPHDKGTGGLSFLAFQLRGGRTGFGVDPVPLAGQTGSYSGREQAVIDLLAWMDVIRTNLDKTTRALSEPPGFKNLGQVRIRGLN
jgi:hypothetical protein